MTNHGSSNSKFCHDMPSFKGLIITEGILAVLSKFGEFWSWTLKIYLVIMSKVEANMALNVKNLSLSIQIS